METWGQMRKQGKRRFILGFGMVISIPFVIDYYIIKLLLNSFRITFDFTELLLVWIVCILLALLFGMYGWDRMEKDWQEKINSE
ncbi:hypothetical protein F7731_21070 [Cytobacillus depressus]|uniref:Uncharacterized protein n=1 Tax=Cytobacillus depressus TaxID=1602942 RepID=A0A6L3UZC0_9BACI|nr:hypothetical protein [Cytobacillus depressus]KAB2329957.1 hypothetical protein F7731_21070 [Cytobacillus depressus]